MHQQNEAIIQLKASQTITRIRIKPNSTNLSLENQITYTGETMFGNIKNASGENLDYTFHDGDTSSQQIVVLGHGVTGNKDRPFLVELAKNLSKSGIPTLRFSFSGNGDSDGEFTESTISKEIGDFLHQ